MIPEPLRPSQPQVKALEDLRREHNIPHEVLAGRVMDSTVTTRRVQGASVAAVRRQHPGASDVQVWQAVLESRATAQPPFGWGWDRVRIQSAMTRIKSFEDLVAFVVETENRIQSPPPDPMGLGSRVDEILSA